MGKARSLQDQIRPTITFPFPILTAEGLARCADHQQVKILTTQQFRANDPRVKRPDIIFKQSHLRVVKPIGCASDGIIIHCRNNSEVAAL
jgi:hypothetical protein